MTRERLAEKKSRTNKIIHGLRRTYPDAHCELNFSNPLELLIATILSAQCTDRQVNIVTESLFKKYSTALAFGLAPLPELEGDIRRIGLFRNKARNIQAACLALVQKHGGSVPRTLGELVELDGVGRKTANVVLGNAFGLSEGFVVDTHVARLSGRLDLSRQTAAEKIEQDICSLVPREEWTLFSHLLIWHGRRQCFARSPDCEHCEIAALCPAGQKVLDPKWTEAQRRKIRSRI